MFRVNNRNIGKSCQIRSKLITKILERFSSNIELFKALKSGVKKPD